MRFMKSPCHLLLSRIIFCPLAGSLLNLAKHPSSTVQILGAEKALFRYNSMVTWLWARVHLTNTWLLHLQILFTELSKQSMILLSMAWSTTPPWLVKQRPRTRVKSLVCLLPRRPCVPGSMHSGRSLHQASALRAGQRLRTEWDSVNRTR